MKMMLHSHNLPPKTNGEIDCEKKFHPLLKIIIVVWLKLFFLSLLFFNFNFSWEKSDNTPKLSNKFPQRIF